MRPATATSTGNSPPIRCRRGFSASCVNFSCRPVLEAEDGLAAGATGFRLAPRLSGAPSAGGGQFWLVLAGDSVVDGGDPLPANSCIFVGPEEPAFAGTSGRVGAELLCLQFRRHMRD